MGIMCDFSASECQYRPAEAAEFPPLAKVALPLMWLEMKLGAIAEYCDLLGDKRNVGPRDDPSMFIEDSVLKSEGG